MEHKYNENEEKRIVNIINDEWTIGKSNSSYDIDAFEESIELFDNENIESTGDWRSNISIPEFASQMLTQISNDVGQYFQTRDFIETYIQDSSDEALLAADASEELINRTLNRKDLYYFQKFVRAKSMNNIAGFCYAECGWEQEIKNVEFKKDQFWFDILDPRNIQMDSSYCYSLQQKEWIIIRRERTLNQLKNEAKKENYFNLELLKELKPTANTEAQKDTIAKDTPEKNSYPSNKTNEKFDIYKRFGQYWILNGKPGIDENGEVKDKAELKELIITTARSGSSEVLIGFHETPYLDAKGNPYRPLIRGLCYIHPTKDIGVGDGHYAKPLQIGINDTFNVSNDRVLLATFPVFKGKKYVTDETDTIRIEPDHLIELNEPDDLQELKISDNIQGAMQQLGILISKMQQTTSIYPTTMGAIPDDSSTTATAIQGANTRSNQRSQYKSMTFEYTFLNELYWMIQQMTWQFAKPETGVELMGDKVFNFNPALDYFFKPLSQSIQSDEAKAAKIRSWTTILQTIMSSPNENMAVIFNYIMMQIIMLMGDEYVNFADKFLTGPLQESSQGSPQAGQEMPTGNQFQIPQGDIEQNVRANAF
jgi:hypothetical protein